MTAYVALLRAVNVGGTGALAMEDLRALCQQAGFRDPRTYIASGNVLFDSDAPESEVKATLAARLRAHTGRDVGVLLRTAEEMTTVLAANPFPQANPKHTVAVILDAPPPPDALASMTGRAEEDAALGLREIYVSYGPTMGRSRLRIPAAESGTARNMNTVAKLAALLAARAG
ncbi:hypothetical protein Rumeso_00253 [Rubellimicrobium mesophilum DSM 19309]|uniref:DUF1697 domain-containing protein n=1 Tax=Rubellimicrobium mesophilum DSM 19309 TaxID=442562 RepID=A0A017HV12_9RHOB|nr:DUF1697 domain-containing protein [Rubellimicrobium mesophilum]EYD78160.1 hypothetical protein Rumeso_00253 [Rubellimicrobium mesophilum DSM 19309]